MIKLSTESLKTEKRLKKKDNLMEIPSDMRSREESKGKIEKEKVKRD